MLIIYYKTYFAEMLWYISPHLDDSAKIELNRNISKISPIFLAHIIFSTLWYESGLYSKNIFKNTYGIFLCKWRSLLYMQHCTCSFKNFVSWMMLPVLLFLSEVVFPRFGFVSRISFMAKHVPSPSVFLHTWNNTECPSEVAAIQFEINTPRKLAKQSE